MCETSVLQCEWVLSSPEPQAGQAERFALMCPAADVGPERLRTGVADDCICRGAPSASRMFRGAGGGGPGLGGADQSALASSDHFSQGKPVKTGPSPSSVYKTTNACPVSATPTHPDPVERETSHSVFMTRLHLTPQLDY